MSAAEMTALKRLMDECQKELYPKLRGIQGAARES
jgi:hypothetical protein